LGILARSMEIAGTTSLLDLDRDLAKGLAGTDELRARNDLQVDVMRARQGRWDPSDASRAARRGFGLFVADGFLVREVTLGHRSAAELVGPGDLVRPWQEDVAQSSYPLTSRWRALSTTTFAVLTPDTTTRMCSFPPIITELTERLVARTRRQLGHQVIAQLAAVEHRILLALWQLADEFGRVRRDGVLVPVPMTHEVLGMLVGARRPTVTGALGVLAERGQVSVERGEGWLLAGAPPTDLDLVRGRRDSS